MSRNIVVKPVPYRPFVATEKFWRFSKYLLPLDLTAWFLEGTTAPQELLSPGELAIHRPDKVQVTEVGRDRDWGGVQIRAIDKGQLKSIPWSPEPQNIQTISRFEDASFVGRHSAIIACGVDSAPTLVRDFGYFVDDRDVRHRFPFGRLNPQFWRYRWLGDIRNRGQLPPISTISGTVAVLNNPWCHNFYHWLLEVAPRALMLRRSGIQADWYAVDCQYGYQKRALEMMGIPRTRLIQPHCGLHLKPDVILRPSTPGLQEWRTLAQTVKQSLPEWFRPKSGMQQRRIYVTRRAAAHRKLVNEQRLEAMLKSYGFETFSFEEIDFATQVGLVSNAEAIISVHGAALAHLVFARPGTSVVEICPESRYNLDCFPRLSQRMGHDHIVVLAQSTRFRQNLRVEVDQVEMAVQLLNLRQAEGRGTQGIKVA